MIAAPWYLFSLGVVLVLIGLITGGLTGAGRSSRNAIDPRLSDNEIAKRLKRQSSLGFSGFLVCAGLLCALISIVWRMIRKFP
jgi:hypothetical protein